MAEVTESKDDVFQSFNGNAAAFGEGIGIERIKAFIFGDSLVLYPMI